MAPQAWRAKARKAETRLQGGFLLLDRDGASRASQVDCGRSKRPYLYFGAGNRNRTCDPIITNDVLYQLSYSGGRREF
jgi:hypothetical protein